MPYKLGINEFYQSYYGVDSLIDVAVYDKRIQNYKDSVIDTILGIYVPNKLYQSSNWGFNITSVMYTSTDP